MKFFLLFSLAFLMITGRQTCKDKKATKASASCFKGRLVVKANCLNYVISVTEGNIDSMLVEASWRDEAKGKTFSNAFALDSRCSFPKNINEGDEFYFVIDSSAVQDCAVCKLYYPVPSRRLPIRVIEEPCAE